MKFLAPLLLVLAISAAQASPAKQLPIGDGSYVFTHKDAEFENMVIGPVTVKIKGHHITVISHNPSDVFGQGIIDEGTLMWHNGSKEWIIGEHDADRFAKEVGGCSGGPTVVDLRKKIYWSC